jgi:hypothetical protein
MSSEPLTTPTTPAETAAGSEKGLLIAMLALVVLGAVAMLLI